MIEKKKLVFEKTVLIGVITARQDEEQALEYLAELAFLAHTAGGEVIKQYTQKMTLPNPKTFIGSGKLQEIQQFVKENEVSTLVFDDELTPAQQRNIEEVMKCKILDRTGLILDIFAQRAQTSYARNQVELAQYQYLLPRLKGLWTHLERQRGGVGFIGGPGETQIESDRRALADKISRIKKLLRKVMQTRLLHRKNRKKNDLPS